MCGLDWHIFKFFLVAKRAEVTDYHLYIGLHLTTPHILYSMAAYSHGLTCINQSSNFV